MYSIRYNDRHLLIQPIRRNILQVDNSSDVAVPNHSGWTPLVKCSIVVKFRDHGLL